MNAATMPGLSKVPVFLESIKFSHSVFALPFALIAMMVAAGGWPDGATVFWIVVACVAARTAAMAWNRLADADIDARNPRTRNRALVTGALTPAFMQRAVLAGSAVFLFAAGMLNRTCLVAAPPVLGVLLGYSHMKRHTRYAHFVLGLALALAPVGAWVAVRESLSAAPLALAAAVLLWVAGFDVLYACQDYRADKREPGLHSIPKSLGLAGAMRLARRLHAACFALFLLFWLLAPGLGIVSLLGVAAVGALLRRQHGLLTPRDLSRMDAAFFTANGLIAVVFFACAWVDLAVLR